MTMRSVAAAFLLALLAAFAPAQSFADDTAPKPLMAHPAMWRVTGKHGTAYLLGSIHVMPLNVEWHSREVKDAIKRSDVFVFEIPIDDATKDRIKTLIAERGRLPKGQKLRDMLPPDSQKEYDGAMTYLDMPPATFDDKRPWLASLMMDSIVLLQRHRLNGGGVDDILFKEAKNSGKELRFLETVDQQIALIMPADPAIELKEFEMELHTVQTQDHDLDTLTSAWTSGDTETLAKVSGLMFEGHPEARAAFFDDRNRAWVKKIEAMLGERKTFFITAGAGHLVGENSVPALLRAAGYKVEGP